MSEQEAAGEGFATLETVVAERVKAREASAAVEEAEVVRDEGGNRVEPEDEREEDQPGEPTPDDQGGPEEATAEEGEETEAEQPPIQPPHSWEAEAKERFNALDRETQEYVVKRERDRDAAVAKAMQEAAEARKGQKDLGDYEQRLTETLERAEEVFKGRWDGLGPKEWAEWAQRDPLEMTKYKHIYDAEREELQRLKSAQQETERKRFEEHLKSEGEKLAQIAPELADPESGPARKAEVVRFLNEQGFDESRLKWLTAAEVVIAYNAMQYASARKTAAEPAKKPKPPAKPVVKPAASAQASPEKSRIEALRKKANDTGSIDDVLAYRLAKGRTAA